MLVTLKARIGSQPNGCPETKQFYFHKYEESKAPNKRRRIQNVAQTQLSTDARLSSVHERTKSDHVAASVV
jgi:predicted metal-dependent enzyme (double-stranded beta helix superfamily)